MRSVFGISALAVLIGITGASAHSHAHHRHYAFARGGWLQPDRMGPGIGERYAVRPGDPVDNGSPYPNRLSPDGGLTGPIARSAHGG